MYPSFRRFLMLATALSALGLTGCINQVTNGKPLAPLDYQHIAPLYISMGQVDVVNQYHPTADSDKAASSFPTRPENALNHYAENRLKAKGYEGTLKFIIQDASVKRSVEDADNTVMRWANVGKLDRFDVSIKIMLARIEGNGRQSSDAAIQLNRFISVPQAYSIAKRETTLKDFTEKMIKEVDGMVTSALQDRMHLIVSDDGNAPMGSASTGAGNNGMNNNGMDNNDSSQSGPAVPSLPAPAVHPEALPPPW